MKTWLIVLCALLLTGCAELNQYRQTNFQKRDAYLASPNNDIMFVVESPNNQINQIQCHLSITGPDINNSQSFDTLTPFVYIYPVGNNLQEMAEKKKDLNQSEKLMIDTMMPQLVMVCQSQTTSWINGKIYANGEVVSEHTANVQYGVITLNYQMKI